MIVTQNRKDQGHSISILPGAHPCCLNDIRSLWRMIPLHPHDNSVRETAWAPLFLLKSFIFRQGYLSPMPEVASERGRFELSPLWPTTKPSSAQCNLHQECIRGLHDLKQRLVGKRWLRWVYYHKNMHPMKINHFLTESGLVSGMV